MSLFYWSNSLCTDGLNRSLPFKMNTLLPETYFVKIVFETKFMWNRIKDNEDWELNCIIVIRFFYDCVEFTE